jgi:UDP-N-acetylglucosamine acyltransferase
MIHPTAIVDPTAELGNGVEIGPYVTIMGPSTIGARNKFWAYCSIGQQTQDLKYAGEPTFLEMGDGNTFREFSTVHRATAIGGKTLIGSHGTFLSYSHIAHDCVVGNHVIFSNNGTLAGHVTVEDHVIVGGLSAVHQFCRIGHRAMIGGCTKVVQDVPPYTIADGNPARARGLNVVGLKRAGFSEDQIKELNSTYRTIFRKKLNTSQATAELAQQQLSAESQLLLDFVTSTQRGIIS